MISTRLGAISAALVLIAADCAAAQTRLNEQAFGLTISKDATWVEGLVTRLPVVDPLATTAEVFPHNEQGRKVSARASVATRMDMDRAWPTGAPDLGTGNPVGGVGVVPAPGSAVLLVCGLVSLRRRRDGAGPRYSPIT
ncbi:MAG: hypothetical protein H7Y88_11490 [Phycisphaerales bacterium]|nr:hypothetical protein [Phycisphaerales bacterium]